MQCVKSPKKLEDDLNLPDIATLMDETTSVARHCSNRLLEGPREEDTSGKIQRLLEGRCRCRDGRPKDGNGRQSSLPGFAL